MERRGHGKVTWQPHQDASVWPVIPFFSSLAIQAKVHQCFGVETVSATLYITLLFLLKADAIPIRDSNKTLSSL